MLPVLFNAEIIKIYTFGVFLMLAFFWALFWFWRNIKLTSFKEEEMFDGVFTSLFGALFFARLVHVLLNYEEFGASILKFILINGYPGLSFAGGLIGGLLTALLFTRIKRLPFLEVMAYAVPPLFLAMCIGKLGAFFSGTTVGTVTSFPLSIQYLGHSGLRHIVAVYEAFFMLAGFFLTQRMLLKHRRDKIHVGSLLSTFLIITSFSYLLLDFLKDDAVYLGSVRVYVVLPAIVMTIAIVGELIRYRKPLFNILRRTRK